MGRKRAPQYQYICIRCGGAVDGPWEGAQHISGGGSRGQKACGKPPIVRLRSEWEAEMDAAAKAAVAEVRRHINANRPLFDD